ncbi:MULTISPECIES: carbamoyl phosphate synthase small subunit [unclassified Streptococcus]|uniref:carbamoyl phosphate synthase small subunit n=1 Tax=unclassified Streptococcus TaxID=2608887 RepID=UPI001071C16E|nr:MULTISPECIES: carbamoyl phosphate synthase small subunit [unclassified Streptococcus]MBF0805846.1 carbamoyl phosphate synthase small subunit [Streptococcus sp. 19428wA2_WM07]TFU28590.1 carbamoyl phosphate synthase small subunit [Streptococcus sp. WM07]
MTKRLLILENGQVFEGSPLGADQDVTGSIVLSHHTSGHQEIISNQTYSGQLLTFTYPRVGNTGFQRELDESLQPSCRAVIVADYRRKGSFWKQEQDLDEYLKAKGITGIQGVDTRALARILTKQGPMKATIADEGDSLHHILDQLVATVLPKDDARQASTRDPFPVPGVGKNIVLLDFGVKHSLLRELSKRESNLIVLPFDTSLERILLYQPDAIVLSSGPGNPRYLASQDLLEKLLRLQETYPMLAIGLGHLLLALANQADVADLPYGETGKQALYEPLTNQVTIADYHHHYPIKRKNFPKHLLATHITLDQDYVMGYRHRWRPVISVQFSPEGSPGPHDFRYLMDEFFTLLE